MCVLSDCVLSARVSRSRTRPGLVRVDHTLGSHVLHGPADGIVRFRRPTTLIPSIRHSQGSPAPCRARTRRARIGRRNVWLCLGPVCTSHWTSEIWIDERFPLRYRGLFRDLFAPYPFRYFRRGELKDIGCMPGSAYEVGGLLYSGSGGSGAIRFVPPNKLVLLPMGVFPLKRVDPLSELRRAIRAGRAHDEGQTKRNGRSAERIRSMPVKPPRVRSFLRVGRGTPTSILRIEKFGLPSRPCSVPLFRRRR